MKVTRKSPLTGIEATMDLDVTQEQLDELTSHNRRLVQEIFPNLTGSQREFVKSGYTQADWDRMFPGFD